MPVEAFGQEFQVILEVSGSPFYKMFHFVECWRTSLVFAWKLTPKYACAPHDAKEKSSQVETIR